HCPRAGHEQEMTSVRKKSRIVMTDLVRTQFGHGRHLPSGSRHAQERFHRLSADENHVSRTPCAIPASFIANHDGRAAGDGDFLELPLSKKSDVPAVRRPEKTLSLLSA